MPLLYFALCSALLFQAQGLLYSPVTQGCGRLAQLLQPTQNVLVYYCVRNGWLKKLRYTVECVYLSYCRVPHSIWSANLFIYLEFI
jgi:hypothetical protein